VKITVKGAGEIVSGHDITEALDGGVIDIGSNATTEDTGRLGPVTYLFGSGLPGGPGPIDFMDWSQESGGLETINKVYQSKYDVIALGYVSPYPAELFCMSNKKIQTIEDFDGLKFRTIGLWAEILESYGASVITIPGTEVYESAQRGIIDAFEFCGPAMNWPMGFQEITKYIGVPGVHSTNGHNVIRFNKTKWDALPEDLQTIILAVIDGNALRSHLRSRAADAEYFQKFIDYGMEIFVLPEATQKQIVASSKEFIAKYAAEDALFKEVWEDQLRFFKEVQSYERTALATLSVYSD